MDYEYFTEVGSTNAVAKQRALAGEGERVIISESQTEGRGRMERSFSSPPSGVYFSILLRRDIKYESLLKVTSLAAVETAKAIEKLTGRRISIKWVNDLLCDGRKICGILTECGFDGDRISYIVIGIGINLGEAPSNVESAGGLNCKDVDKKSLALCIADAVSAGIDSIEGNSFIEEYRKRLCLTGKEIYVIKGDKRISAVAKGVNDMCALEVVYGDGSEEALHSFEVSIRQK